MNSRNKILTTIFVLLILVISMEFLYFQQPFFIKRLNNTLTDQAFIYRGKKSADDRIVIVDIDERSLQKIGQWPWSRDKLSIILQHLTDAGVAIIGLDMVFSEEDRTSPIKIAKDANITIDGLKDYDKIFANTLASTPTIIGFTFNFEDKIKNSTPNINAIFLQRGKGKKESLLVAKGITSNLPIFQQSAYSAGSFNTLPDNDGNIRYVPLVISYDDAIYPTLSFEMIRTLYGTKKVEIIYDENGVSFLRIGELEIPTDKMGRLFVNYRGGAKSYQYISAFDIFNNSFDKSKLKDKIVIIGTSAAGLLDLRSISFDGVYPGVEVHANIIDNLLNGDLISSQSYTKGITIISIAVSIILSSILLSFLPPFISLPLIISFLVGEFAYFYHMLFDEKLLLNIAYPLLSTFLSLFVFTFLKIYFEYKHKEMIKDKFFKKVSPQVAAQLLKNSQDVFSVSEAEITIFFSDIRSFTNISEELNDPKILIDYLNTYMSPMSEIIIEHEGTIDKYIGDAIMAYWNAPLRVKNHADKALSASIKQIKALKELNIDLKKRGLPAIDIGIGLHTGNAIAGEMGSIGRSDYTVIGDSINLGSRIEGLCKPYGAKILISASTKDALKSSYKLREVDIVQVKGKDEVVTIYEVFGFGEFSKEEMIVEDIYQKARELYLKGEFKVAYPLFYDAFKLNGDKLFALYMDRCISLQKENIQDFDGVYKFITK